jgi:hypothetical protein
MEEMGLMRTRYGWLVGLLTAGLALTPAVVYGQGIDAGPPDPVFPLPIGKDRMENGGFFVALEGLFWRQTNPLHDQQIAVRGVLDTDGSISQALFGGAQPGLFFGSRTAALRADDAGGPGTYSLGFRLTGGWKFANDVSLEVSWIHLFDAKYAATASVLPAFARSDPLLADTFLTSFVFNFPPDFAGPAQKVNLGNPGATFGIWDASSEQEIRFTQRFNQADLSVRWPLMTNDCMRTYWLCGPRMVWLWEQFWWRTVAFDITSGAAGQDDVAIYSNVVSQRLYGGHIGAGWDWKPCETPIGTFAISVEGDFMLSADVVKERAKYERGDFAIAAQRAITTYTVVPELSAKVNLWWYPIEAVQVRIGYDLLAFFNTVSSPDPVSFNFGALDPPWVKGTTRIFDGFEFGVAISF